MTKKRKTKKQEAKEKQTADINQEKVENQENESSDNKEETQEKAQDESSCEDDKDQLKNEIAELKDKHLRLFSEFDNFRKRNAKERIELFKTANADLMLDLLPVLDDFDRAIKSFEETKDVEAVKEGILHIQKKFIGTLERKGLKCMESKGKDFDTDFHEAITEIPAPTEELKSKVVDVAEKGYMLNDKVIRYAKVIVGK